MPRPADGLLGEVAHVGAGVDEAGHAGGDERFQLLILAELGKAEGFALVHGLDKGGLAVLDDLHLDAVFAQHMRKGPGDQVFQGWRAAVSLVGMPPTRATARSTLSIWRMPCSHGHVAQTGGKAHAIQDGDAFLLGTLMQPFAIVFVAHLAAVQALVFFHIGAAVVFFQHIHAVDPRLDRRFDRQVAGAAGRQGGHRHIIPLHDLHRGAHSSSMLSGCPTIFFPSQCFTADKPASLASCNAHHFATIIRHQVPGHCPANLSTPSQYKCFHVFLLRSPLLWIYGYRCEQPVAQF